MRVFHDPDEGRWQADLTTFALGAVGGVALGVLISRLLPERRDFGTQLRYRARSVARRLRPARLQRLATDQVDLDRLEDTVLDAFLTDEVLSERGVDIGAISHGIIELSGSVWSEDEAERAVALANRCEGVRTVVNRLEIDGFGQRPPLRRQLDEEELEGTFAHHEARVGGMGRRRQSPNTDPARRDDSQHLREDALAAADRDQFAEEVFDREPVESAPEDQSRYSEDELDHQEPHGRRRSGQELNSRARVGRGLDPGTELRLERSELTIEDSQRRDRE